MTRTYRPSPMLILVGLLFAAAPIFMGILSVNQVQTTGMKINGVMQHDVSALGGVFAFLGIFLLVGLGFILYGSLSRIVVSETGIHCFNLIGLETLGCPWMDVTGITREHSTYSNRWTILAEGKKASIGSAYNVGPILQSLVAHVPADKWQASTRSRGSLDPISGPIRSSLDSYVLGFSVIWYGFIAFFLFTLLNKLRAYDATPFLIFLGVLAVLPAAMFYASWKRYFSGYIEGDRDRILLNDGLKTKEMRWADVLVASDEARKQGQSGGRGYNPNAQKPMGSLILVSGSDILSIPVQVHQFQAINDLAAAALPQSAHVYLYALDDMDMNY